MFTRFKIFEKLHQSGSHTVLKGYDTYYQNYVSIRQIFTCEEIETISEEQLTLFKYEILRLLSLNHPCLNMFHAIIRDEHGLCLITDMHEGGTLDSLLAKGPVKLRDFLQIAFSMLHAVEYIHQRGVLHRALTPDKIQVDRAEDGHLDVMVLDVAYEHIADAGQQGKPSRRIDPKAVRYLAPEQLLPGGELGPYTDLYALGCIFYYCLSGQHAFQGTDAMDEVKRHLGHHVVRLHDLCPRLPLILCDWVMWLINVSPQHRPASTRNVIDTLTIMTGYEFRVFDEAMHYIKQKQSVYRA